MSRHAPLASILLQICFFVFTAAGLAREPLLTTYPHWDRAQLAKLETIDTFVERMASRGDLAVFDYDGTMIGEEYRTPVGDIRCGQSTWHVWGAHHLAELPFLFPGFLTDGGAEEQRTNILAVDDVLEGKTNVVPESVTKFWRIATFESGMTERQMRAGIERYLDAYPPSRYVFLPVLDVLQRMLDRGIRVWLVTGSNPYFIATVLARIERTVPRAPGRRFDFGDLAKSPFVPFVRGRGGSRIVGNMARLDRLGRFTDVYDDRFVTNPERHRYVVDGEGKRVAAAHFIEPLEQARVVFCAGNSDGDYPLMRWIIDRDQDRLGLAVNARGQRLPNLTDRRVIHLSVEPPSK
ncbi:MAG: hypothetical protein HY815_00425 [Candidatus Riflebacteria bacterium]|nr:hypothetical protein [Candidatus Riflebacteria bacterium]